jgi:leader peptidase (prepilin peptidase)/N-methyltransferase
MASAASGPLAGYREFAGLAADAAVPGRQAAGPLRVGVVSVALCGLVAWSADGAALAGLVVAALAGLVLAALDQRTHRLPDAVVFPAHGAVAVLLAAASALAGDPAATVRAGAAAAVTFGVFYLLALVPSGLGYGDAKLAGLLGTTLGWCGWPTLLNGILVGFCLGGAGAVVLLVTRRASWRTRLAYGPFLLAGALVALVLTP